MEAAAGVAILTGAVMGAALLYSLRARPGSAGSRLLRRGFWSLFFLWAAGMLGLPGISPLRWALTAALGLPGYGAAAALAALAA